MHIRSSGNTGDLASCPADYFKFPDHSVGDLSDPIPRCDAIIFGGGTLTSWAADVAKGVSKRILWGTGSTRHGEREPWPDPDGFALVGAREWTAEREAAGRYAPCASCMSPLFDDDYPIEREAVRFINADASIKRRYPIAAADLPTMENTEPLDKIVAFLASAKIVVTNSFHGMFWATLLGRRVVCVPYSSKFYSQKFTPAYSGNGAGWRATARKASTYPEALDDCRAASRRFHERVMEILNPASST